MRQTLLAVVVAVAAFTGCDSTEPGDGPGEQEFITLVRLNMTDDSGNAVAATASDPDGDGVNIQITPLSLVAGRTYTGTITLRDDINGEDVTAEVAEEADEHQFFYTPEGGAVGRLTVTITDRDANNLPVGLEYRIVVSPGAAASGILNVVLSHYGDEAKDGTRRSTDTDVDLDFPVTIGAQ